MKGQAIALRVVLYLLVQTGLIGVRAHEPPLETNQSIRATAESLIRQLKSPNKDLNPKVEPFVRLPPEYDRQGQKAVEEAEQKLIALGKDAFPILIEHLNDTEYSQSLPTAILRGFSVGEVCLMIIQRQVEPRRSGYKVRGGSDGEFHGMDDYLDSYSRKGKTTRDGMRRWWSDHQQKMIRQMQIEALEWTIRRESEIGFPHPGDRELYLDPLVKKLAELKER
jgi:hypothetical protein